MTKGEIAKLIDFVQGIYPTKELLKDSMKSVWEKMFSEFDYDVTIKAFIEVAKDDDKDFNEFPSTGKFYTYAKNQHMLYDAIKQLAYDGKDYDTLSFSGQQLITREKYNKLLLKDKEDIKKTHIKDLV